MSKFLKNLHTLVIAIVCLVVVGTSGIFVATAKAQSNSPNYGQALEIAPPLINLSANPGQAITTQVYLRDVSRGDLIVTGQANDFTAAGENGTPKILLNENETANNPYSMKDWIAAPAQLRLIPKEVKAMKITINVPANASPGGHYAAIRFTATPPELKSSGVSLSTSLGALILLTVKGDVKESMSIKDFSVNKDGKNGKIFQSAPLGFTERLENKGNIHEEPAGLVTITNMFGKKIATLGINQPPRNVLPASTRKFDQKLDKTVIGTKKLFGRYTAKLEVTYGKNKQKVSSTITFWVIPWKLIAIVIAALIAGFFALRYGLRRYNRYILNRARGHRK